MKGLASTDDRFTAVKIGGRLARKSYGAEVSDFFNEATDDIARRYVKISKRPGVQAYGNL